MTEKWGEHQENEYGTEPGIADPGIADPGIREAGIGEFGNEGSDFEELGNVGAEIADREIADREIADRGIADSEIDKPENVGAGISEPRMERKRRERPRISLEEMVRIEKQAEKNRQKSIFFKWSIPATILLVLIMFLGLTVEHELYITEDTGFFRFELEQPENMAVDEFVSVIQREAGINGLMLFAMDVEHENSKALLYGTTVTFYCSNAVETYLKEILRRREGTWYGLLGGRIDVSYHDFSGLTEEDMSTIVWRGIGGGKGAIQFISDMRSVCTSEFRGGEGNGSAYPQYQKDCVRNVAVVLILLLAIWGFYYLHFVRDVKFRVSRKVVIGGLLAVCLLYGVWWQIAVRLSYGPYQRLMREKGLYSNAYIDPETDDSYSVDLPTFPVWDTGSIVVGKDYGEEGSVYLFIIPKMYGEPEYQLSVYQETAEGSRVYDRYSLEVDERMVPVGANDPKALVVYESNYDMLCRFWESLRQEGWMQ